MIAYRLAFYFDADGGIATRLPVQLTPPGGSTALDYLAFTGGSTLPHFISRQGRTGLIFTYTYIIIHTGFYFARPGGSADPYVISYGGTLATFFVSKQGCPQDF